MKIVTFVTTVTFVTSVTIVTFVASVTFMTTVKCVSCYQACLATQIRVHRAWRAL